MAFKTKKAARAYHAKWRSKNRDRVNSTAKRYYDRHPERRRHIKRKSLYGITEAEWTRLYDLQGGACAICRKPESECQGKRLCVDHNHDTKAVRALVCHACNRALGSIGDDEVVAASLLAYLKHHKRGDPPCS